MTTSRRCLRRLSTFTGRRAQWISCLWAAGSTVLRSAPLKMAGHGATFATNPGGSLNVGRADQFNNILNHAVQNDPGMTTDEKAFVAAQLVPEPSTWGMFVLGGAFLTWRRA